MAARGATYGRRTGAKVGPCHISSLTDFFSDDDGDDGQRRPASVEKGAAKKPSRSRSGHGKNKEQTAQHSSEADAKAIRDNRLPERTIEEPASRPSTPPNAWQDTPHLSDSSSLSPIASIASPTAAASADGSRRVQVPLTPTSSSHSSASRTPRTLKRKAAPASPASPRKISIARELNRIFSPTSSSKTRQRKSSGTTALPVGESEEEHSSEDGDVSRQSQVLSRGPQVFPRPHTGLAARMAARRVKAGATMCHDQDEDTVEEQETKMPEVTEPSSQSSFQSECQPVLGVLAPTVAHARRTYGKERSFLAVLNAGMVSETVLSTEQGQPNKDGHDDGRAAGMLNCFEESQHKSYTEMRRRWGDVEDDGSDEEQESEKVCNVTSLRTAGELRRFREEFEYLTGGLVPGQSLDTRVASALELARHCIDAAGDGDEDGDEGTSDAGSHKQDDRKYSEDNSARLPSQLSFIGMLDVCGLTNHLWSLLHQAGVGKGLNRHLDLAGAVILAKLSVHRACAEALLEAAGVGLFEVLAHLLQSIMAVEEGRQNADKRASARSQRREKATEETLDDIIKQSGLAPLTVDRSASLRRLVLCILCSLSQLPRASTNVGQGILQRFTMHNKDRHSIFEIVVELGLESHADCTEDACPDYASIALSAQLVDHVFCASSRETSSTIEEAELKCWAEQWTAMLSTLYNDFFTKTQEQAGGPLVSLLRLCVNLTQIDKRWSETFAKTSDALARVASLILAASMEHGSTVAATTELRSDIMAFSLGLLTNILESSPANARPRFRRLQLKRTDLHGGPGQGKVMAMSLLGQLFERERVRSHESAQSGFLSGCLAVSLSLVLDAREEGKEGDKEGVEIAKAALQEGLDCTWETVRERLVEVLSDFAAMHEEMARCREGARASAPLEVQEQARGDTDISLVRLLESRLKRT